MAKKISQLICIMLVMALIAPAALAQESQPLEPPGEELAEHVPGEILIRFQPWVNSAQAEQHLVALNLKVKRQVPALGVKLVKLPPGLDVEEAIMRFSKRPGIEYVEPNYILQLSALQQEEITDQWSLLKIQAPQAWETFSDLEKVPVLLATVDTGIDRSHPDLEANIWSNADEIADNNLDDDGNGFIDDTWGWDFANNDSEPFDDNLHGTAVSSVMAGVLDGSGVAGVCPWCQVMAVKVLTAQGTGTLDVVSNGIIYAADNGARAINLSLAGTAGAQTLQDAVDYAWNKGVLILAGAGNNGANAPMYPAGYANAMAIASTGEADTHSCFSNYAQDYISVAAPGENMLIALPNEGYGYGSGTSLSTPMVTGLAGLLFSQDAERTNSLVKQRIESTAVDLSPAGVDPAFGFGRIDAFRAVTNDGSNVPPPDGVFSTNGTASGYAHARKLVRDIDGKLHVIWHTQEGPLFRIRYATSSDNGASWDLQPDVFSSENETYHSALAADSGYLYVAIPSRGGAGQPYQILFTRKPLSSGTWSTPESLMGGSYDAVRPDLFLDPTNGKLHLLASSFDNSPLLYYRFSTNQGTSWSDPVIEINPSLGTQSAGANTRYATIHANGENLYIASRTMTQILGLFTYYYLHTVRSTDGGQTWIDQTHIASFFALTSGEYGISLAGVGNRLYMGYEVGSNMYFRRFDNNVWSDFETLETGDASNINKWPTITQAPDGKAWLLFEVNGELFMRQYDGNTWATKESLGKASYANFKLGTSGERVEWIATQCNGAPFKLTYGGIQLSGNGNHPPQADPQSVSTEEDTSLAITLTASDPENDPLNYTITDQPTHGILIGDAPDVTYQPATNYNGMDSFTFITNDGISNSNSATVSIQVIPVNDPPAAHDGMVTTVEDTPEDITLVGDDVDGDVLTYTVMTDPLHGTLSGSPPDITYSPDQDYSGPDSFDFIVNDGLLDSDPGTITIMVSAENDPPVAINQSVSTDEDNSLAVTLTGSDSEHDPLTFRINNAPGHGSLAGTAPFVTYHPDANYYGTDSFTFIASDGSADSPPGTVSITIVAVNDVPSASDISDSTQENTADTWNPVVADVDGDKLNCSIFAQPGGGASASVTIDCSSGQYIPPPGYSGTDSFTYQVCDTSGACNQAVVSYTISANSLHVGDLDGSAALSPRNRWDAMVTIEVHDALENLVADAFVEGTWSDGASGGGSCTTNASGVCLITKPNLKSNVTSTIFTINNITHADLNYKPGDNHDPDGDSQGTTIVVYQISPPGNLSPQASFSYDCMDLACDFDGSGSSDPDGVIVSHDWDFGGGNTGSGPTASFTFAEAGTYPVILTVTDDAGASDTTTQQISVSSTGIQFLHVGDMVGTGRLGRTNRWEADVTIAIHSGNESLFEGATITGTWTTGREMSCTTSSSGSCQITLTNLKTALDMVTFTVTNVSAPGWEYNANENHETAITINRP